MKIISIIKIEETKNNIVFEIEYETKSIFGKSKIINRKAFTDRNVWYWLDDQSFINGRLYNGHLNALSEMSFKGRFYL